MRRNVWILLPFCALVCVCAFPALVFAQANAPQAAGQAATQTSVTPSRITQAIDEANLTRLSGNTHPLAQARFDQGAAPDSLPMQRMLLVLKRSAAQESTLDALLDQQQDSTSANFHQWLTPQQFGQQFGPSDQDVQTITSWLQSQGFTVAGVSNGRTVIEFSGTAGQVRQAFHTEIHRYTVNGQDHWANNTDPQIPAALTPVVAGINTLYNFPRQALHHLAGAATHSAGASGYQPAAPSSSLFNLNGTCGVSGSGCHWLSPYDFATIYNLLPLWNASTPTDGTGQTIAIAGESDISLQDIQSFRSYFGLPSDTVNVIINGPDPGIVSDDETESDLDVEWSGAVARGATIDFVTSESTEVEAGVDLSAQYAVDNNLAPVLSMSYGVCELFLGQASNEFFSQLWQQASAQGITVLVSEGDSGSAVCDRNAGTRGAAVNGLSVNGISSTPYNVAVGGTDFFDLTDFSQFWNSTNTPPAPGAIASESALSYIPETTWNDSCTNAVFGTLLGFSTNPETNCNNSQLSGFVAAVGGSGGMSNCIASTGLTPSTCTDGYPKPPWQSVLTPADGARDLPDISLYAASGSPSGSAYILCEADQLQAGETSCDSADPNTYFLGIGGTSASAPAFAGLMALVNQATGARQGNANYVLYKLAAASGASCNSTGTLNSNCVFYDTTNGTIAMPCVINSPDEPGPDSSTCPITFAGDAVGVLSGYSTATGYDLATGLGSVNAANLISRWKTFNSSLGSSTTSLTLNNGSAVNITHGQIIPAQINVTGPGGTPSGTVSLIAQTGAESQHAIASATLVNGSATFSTTSLPGGTDYAVFAQYSGDGTFAGSKSASTQVTVLPETSKIAIAYELFNPTTGVLTNPNATSAIYGTPSLLRVSVASQAEDACPSNVYGSTSCPTGSITITDSVNGAAPIPLDAGSYSLNSEGTAEDQVAQLSGGIHVIQVAYAGDNSYTSGNASETITIAAAQTTTSTSAPFTNVFYQGNNTINAVVTGMGNGAAMSGQVTFLSGNTQLGTAPLTNSIAATSQAGPQAQATISTSQLPLGTDSVTASYSGDGNYVASTSSPISMSVRILTGCFPSSSSSTVAHGSSVTFTAKVTATLDLGPGPTGTVTFTNLGYGALGTVPLVNGQAQLTTSSLPGGNLTIDASYSGDSDYTPSGSEFGQTVTLLPAAISLSSSASAISGGSPLTFTATVSPTQSGGPSLTGSVQFFYYFNVNGSDENLGAAVTISNGEAQLTSSVVPAGTVFVGARYNGDANYATALSGAVTETVAKVGTTVSVTSLTPTIQAGANLTFEAQATPAVSGWLPMTGTIELLANGSSLGSSSILTNGQTSIAVTLSAGVYQVQAIYGGDSNYSGSTSPTITQTVTGSPSFTVSATPTSLTINAPGQSASTILSLTSQSGLAGSGGLPSSTCGTSLTEEISCSLSSFTLPANGTATATLTFASTAPAASLVPGARYDHFVFGTHSMRILLFSVFFCLITLTFAVRRKNQRWRLVFGTVIFAVIVSGVSCGGRGASGGNNPPPNPGTPAGAVSPLTVSITINGVTQTVPNLTLTVN